MHVLRALTCALLAATLLAGCALRPVNPPLAQATPAGGYRWSDRTPPLGNDPHTLLILAFSGGGTRAAAFSYGVLEELARTPLPVKQGKATLLREIDLITGVSGGSFTALSYALYGEQLFQRYEPDFLNRNVENELLKRLFDPLTWPSTLSAGFGRSELAEQYYDEILFHGATIGDLVGKPAPIAVASATDVATGTRWDFTQANFDVICSDLSKMRLSRVAAASSAVPVVMSPVTINNYGGSCGYRAPDWVVKAAEPRKRAWPGSRTQQRLSDLASFEDRERRPYIHLVDGGLSGNLALYGIVETMQEIEVSRDFREMTKVENLRRIAVVIVNARSAPNFGFDRREAAPNSLELLMQAINVPIDRYSYESIDALEDVVTEWNLRRRLVSRDRANAIPDIEFSVIDISFEAVQDPAEKNFLYNLPTSLFLPPEAITRLRSAASTVLRESPEFQKLLQRLQAAD